MKCRLYCWHLFASGLVQHTNIKTHIDTAESYLKPLNNMISKLFCFYIIWKNSLENLVCGLETMVTLSCRCSKLLIPRNLWKSIKPLLSGIGKWNNNSYLLQEQWSKSLTCSKISVCLSDFTERLTITLYFVIIAISRTNDLKLKIKVFLRTGIRAAMALKLMFLSII